MTLRRRELVAGLLLSVAAAGLQAQAAFPTKPIQIVVRASSAASGFSSMPRTISGPTRSCVLGRPIASVSSTTLFSMSFTACRAR